MSWPPTLGDRLPHATEAYGIKEKLQAYCLNLDHEVGGPKAQGFQRILGIDQRDLEYLAGALRRGVLHAPVTDVRDNSPFGVLCEVRIPIAGRREHHARVMAVTTSWEIREPDALPRLVTAYING